MCEFVSGFSIHPTENQSHTFCITVCRLQMNRRYVLHVRYTSQPWPPCQNCFCQFQVLSNSTQILELACQFLPKNKFKKHTGILFGIALNLQINVGRMDILTIMNFLFIECGISLHLFRSFKISRSNVCGFYHTGVTKFTPKQFVFLMLL